MTDLLHIVIDTAYVWNSLAWSIFGFLLGAAFMFLYYRAGRHH